MRKGPLIGLVVTESLLALGLYFVNASRLEELHGDDLGRQQAAEDAVTEPATFGIFALTALWGFSELSKRQERGPSIHME